MALTTSGLYKTAGYRALMRSSNEIGVALKNAFVGDNAALGSIFEDEAVIIPNPQIPLRLKDVNFFTKSDSNSSSQSPFKDLLRLGGAFTSLRLRTTDINGVAASGGKGNDIEIDYTIIDPDNHVAHLVELKKGLGAQKKGDAIQLIRAGQVLSYHYAKVHPGRKLKLYYYFVAGDASDPANVVFFGNGVDPNLFQITTSEGFANLIGMDAARILRIMRIRPHEQAKYARTLFALESVMFSSNPNRNTVAYIPDLIESLTPDQRAQIPNWMNLAVAVRNRVSRLKDLDDLGPYIFKKRQLSKQLRAGGLTNSEEKTLFSTWLGCVKKLSENTMIRPEKRSKYITILNRTKGIPLRIPELSLSEKLSLRKEQLGPKRYATNPIPASNRRGGNWITNGQRVANLKTRLNAIMKGTGPSTRGALLSKLKGWTSSFRMAPISATAKQSKGYKELERLANNYAKIVATNTGSNTYANRINRASNQNELVSIMENMKRNSKLTPNRKKALGRAVLLRSNQLTQSVIAKGRGESPRRTRTVNRSRSPRRANVVLNAAGMNNSELRAAASKLGVQNASTLSRRQLVNAYVQKSLRA
jgi:hypothetical protein